MLNKKLLTIILATFVVGLFTTSVLAYDPAEQYLSTSWSGVGTGWTNVTATVQRETWDDVQAERTGVVEYEYNNYWQGSIAGGMGGELGDEIRNVDISAGSEGSGYYEDMSKYSFLDVATDNLGIDIVSQHNLEIMADNYAVNDNVFVYDKGSSWIEDDEFMHMQGFRGWDATFFSKSFFGSSSPGDEDGSAGAWAFALPEMGSFSGNLTFGSVDPFNVRSDFGSERGSIDVLQLGEYTTDPGDRVYSATIDAYDWPLPGQVYDGDQYWNTPEQDEVYNKIGR